jgi:hypothetical protein
MSGQISKTLRVAILGAIEQFESESFNIRDLKVTDNAWKLTKRIGQLSQGSDNPTPLKHKGTFKKNDTPINLWRYR